MEQKLIAPNDNYKIAICLFCGDEFIKRTANGTKQLAAGIRSRSSINCSKKCSSSYKHLKSQYKPKENNGTKRKDN